MGRKRAGTRRTARSNPRGLLEVAPDGFGFVSTAEGQFFIPAKSLHGAFDGDLVEVAPARPRSGRVQQDGAPGRPGDRPVARVVAVLHRAHESVVGRYEVADPFGVVVPADPRIPYDIFTRRADRPDIPHGAIVRVRMVEYPGRNTAATGVVEDVLGADGGPSLDVEAVIARRGLRTAFPPEALAEAGTCQVDAEGAVAAGYRDLRGRLVFTIDPADARDFDDALSVEELGGGRVRVGVHIADVAHYVAWGGSVDLAARMRATSVYLSDRVLPMLPEALCNGVCSLVPGQARRAVTVDVVVDEAARVCSVDCYESVICSAARLTYDEALALLDGRSEAAGAGLLADSAQDGVRRHGDSACAAHAAPEGSLAHAESPACAQPLGGGQGAAADAGLLAGGAQDGVRRHGDSACAAHAAPEGSLAHTESPACAGLSSGGQAVGAGLPCGGQAVGAAAGGRFAAQAGLPGDVAAGEGQGEGEVGAAAFLDLKRALRALDRIAGLRRRARRAAGGVDFDAAEAKAVLDDEGEVRGISVRTRTRATSLVEEAMILANECVARRLLDAGMPALFRVHGAPEADSLGELVPVLQELGYGRSVDLVAFACGEPAAIQAVIERARGRAEDELVSGLVLRAMQRAVYSPRNTGHFGLASKAYCHFTSPIRRYPDLVAHRMLKMALHGRAESFSAQEAALPFLAEHASAAERVAEAAARETQELACVAYMARFAGREFDGVASGVSHQGLYVRLPNTVEGLVPSDKLGAEYFALDLARHTLCGQDSGRTFRLGQRLRVRIVGAPAHARKLDLALAE